jgi:hypothetical protein
MLTTLKKLLQHLENNLDEQKIRSSEKLHQAALSWQNIPRLPVIASYPYPENADFLPYPHRQALEDPEKMLFNQLVSSFDTSIYLNKSVGDDLPLSVRADFGCVLIPSMFGAKVEQVEDNHSWIRHDKNNITCESITKKSSADFNMDLISKAASFYRIFNKILDNYTKLSELLNVTLPDLQGPFDNLELIRGSQIFLDMQLHKKDFLEAMFTVTGAQIEIANFFQSVTREIQKGYSHQHGFPHKGGILIRNDTSIMVSPKMYREMIAPFDKQILTLLGGGIHSCGNVNKILPEYFSLKPIECFDFGQSELNNLEKIYTLAKQKRIPLTRIAVTEEELMNGTVQKKFPTGVSLIYRAECFEQAKKIITSYKKKN